MCWPVGVAIYVSRNTLSSPKHREQYETQCETVFLVLSALNSQENEVNDDKSLNAILSCEISNMI